MILAWASPFNDRNPDHPQNLMYCMARGTPLVKVSCKSADHFQGNPSQTNNTKNISPYYSGGK